MEKSFIIDAGKDGRTLIHTPSMRSPQTIREPLIIYQCVRTSLMCALQNNVKSILIPMFGAGTGGVDFGLVADLTFRAYEQIMNPPTEIDWDYVDKNYIPITTY